MHDPRAKIIRDHGKLARKINGLKAAGKKIAFTNGGFDILHAGHVRSLRGAASRADVLVVAVNSDASIRKNKGPHLPVNPLEERMEVLAALESVDFVTCFDEPTVDGLLLKLKPHFHAKGTDYTKKTVPERRTVLSYGGKILITGDPKNHSSTRLMEKIAEIHAAKKRK